MSLLRPDKKPVELRATSRMSLLGRRHFLAGAGSVLLAPSARAAILPDVRSLAFDNLHTGERLKIEYWAEGDYVPQALAEVNHLLRDFRSGDVHPIAPQLLDLLVLLRQRLETAAPVTVISGYRSPATNAMLRGAHEHSGVASKSLHMQGMAIDLRIAGRSLEQVHNAAMSQRGGGVGFYPKSDFVHVDVGRVRSW